MKDVVRVFHGDGPAQQIEAGSKIGGNYPCVGCIAQSSPFSDLAHCYRADTLSISARQASVTTGKAWKNGGTKPLDKLHVKDLRVELQAHGITTKKRTKSQMDSDFDKLRAGINNVPALLQGNPRLDLDTAFLQHYEIIATEPLHDLKGHISNLVD